jgi:hypothetical protein
MKIINKYIITFIILLFALTGKADSCTPTRWTEQVISETKSVKVRSEAAANLDFSDIWLDNRAEFNGNLIIGWYVDLDDRLLYDDISEDSDDYSFRQLDKLQNKGKQAVCLGSVSDPLFR